MIALDTTVLVYAVGAEHPLRTPCRALISAIGEGRVHASTTVEVLQEFTHMRSRRRGRSDAVALARSLARLLAPLTTINSETFDHGMTLFERHDRLGAFDAVLAAAVQQSAHLSGLASADRAFSNVPDLPHHDPADPQFLTSLGVS